MNNSLRKIITMAAIVCGYVLAVTAQNSPVSVKWQMVKNCGREYISQFTFRNISNVPLEANWALYFNKFSNSVKTDDAQAMDIKPIVNNNYCQLKPNERYRTLQPGEEVTVNVIFGGSFRNISDSPDGAHFVYDGTQKALPVTLEKAEPGGSEQSSLYDFANYPDGNYVYADNAISNPAGVSYGGGAYDIFPTPKEVKLKGGTLAVPQSVKVAISPAYLNTVTGYLTERLARAGVEVSDKATMKLLLEMRPSISTNSEYYELKVSKKEITIVGQSREGVLNGIKTLAAVIERSTDGTIPEAEVCDYPDFAYRGMMLDVARNFTPYEQLLDLIDRLAAYKINRFQFHFNDDEAWRLEIPGVPELTEVASRKGFTLNDYSAGHLMPTYGGSGNPDDGKAPANGYITRSQFVEMLKYARERGVKVIPEIETPGHSRASIVAMRHRYAKYIDTDPEEANRYRNFDLTDTTRFFSAQGFHDNVLNPAVPGTYTLLKKIVREMQKMYSDAGLQLDVIHLGGDEVAKGCWKHSKQVSRLMNENHFTTEREVSEYYFKRISGWLFKQGIKVEGWQEVSTGHSDAYNNEIAEQLAGVNVWSTLGREDTIAYDLANRGVPVILSNVNNLYLDLTYRPHELENGLTWGGCVDEIRSWETLPYNIYRSAQMEWTGKPKDLVKAADGKPQLLKPENIIGLQAQLWSETIRSYDMVQSYIFPKIFGLVERAWNARPEWGEGSLDRKKYEEARAQYNLKIGLRELPYLQRSGAKFHVAQPGAVIEDGKLVVNTPYPGMIVRYTTDGSTPTEQSALWTASVPVGDAKLIRVRAYYLGAESVATRLEVK